MSIALEQVSKHFDGHAAVRDVSVDIDDGEFFVLLGPSGSGKSTLLRAIAGLTTVDHGRIVLHGRDVTHLNAREREVGFVFQNYALFRHMSVGDNIEFALRARRVRAAARKARRRELLELVSLEGYDDRLPMELSGGQQQRVAVARALAHEPRVLLLDEPFGALDAKIRDELRRGIREIQRRVGITTILVTHDQDEAFMMADRIGVMDHGRLQEVGQPRALYVHPGTRFVATFLGAANLLLGRHEHEGVRLGASRFDIDQQAHVVRPDAEALVVVRPEDVVVVPRGAWPARPIGRGKVVELEFSGPLERIRLAAEAAEGVKSGLRPDASDFRIEAVRNARDAESAPLAIGQEVLIGAKRVHVLPTMTTSLRLLSGPSTSAEALAAAPLVAELAASMHVTPIRHLEAQAADALRGLPVVGLAPRQDLSMAVGLLGQGAYQVLAADPLARPVERLLIYAQSSRPARDGALSAASSLLRHLAVRATLLVPGQAQSSRGLAYRELLDLRSAALRQHGVDVQTETFSGGLADTLRARLSTGESVMLLVGLTSLAAGAALVEELIALSAVCRPAAVMLVCLGPESETGAALGARAASHGS